MLGPSRACKVASTSHQKARAWPQRSGELRCIQLGIAWLTSGTQCDNATLCDACRFGGCSHFGERAACMFDGPLRQILLPSHL